MTVDVHINICCLSLQVIVGYPFNPISDTTVSNDILQYSLSLFWLHFLHDNTDVVHCESGIWEGGGGKRVDNITTRPETKSHRLKPVCRVHVKLDNEHGICISM